MSHSILPILTTLALLVKALPQDPPSPIGPVFAESVASLLPEEVSVETFNSQYLQKHSSDPLGVLAVAKVLQSADGSLEDVENTVFTTLGPDVRLTTKVTCLSSSWDGCLIDSS